MQLDPDQVFNVVIPAMLSMVGYKRKPEQIAALAAFNKGNQYAKGLQVSPEIRAAVSARFKGKPVPPDLAARRAATRKARNAADPSRKQIGERAPNAKLTEADVLEIRRRVTLGEKHSALAQEFKVTGTTISYIVKRKNWTHI